MKINILYYLIVVFSVTSCVKFKGDIPNDYRELLGAYKTDDTIYFKSNLKDYDTIRISSIDSFSVEQGPDNFPFKQINIRTEYLPKNKWNFGIELRKSNNKYDSIVNDKFIELTKEQANNRQNGIKYEVYARYRDFSGELQGRKLKTNKIDTIVTERETGLDILEKYPVTEIYWSLDKGMIGYKKKDGQVYKLVEK
jgi:hypothetical protein